MGIDKETGVGRTHRCVADELAAAPQEGQKLVVVQAPHPVGARRLQPAA